MSSRKVHDPGWLIRPPRLRAGSRIAVAAPAGCVAAQQLEAGIQLLESAGYRVVVPAEIYHSRRYFAGDDGQRAAVLQQWMTAPDVDALFCARGGFGSMRILPRLDFGAMRRSPKILVGFSDVSALLAALYARCGLITFHGPTITTLAASDPASRAALFDAVSGKVPAALNSIGRRVVQPGRAVAPVLAGNLATLCHLVGTAFQPQLENHILLLEDCNEAPYRIDRMLSQMKQAGCLEGLAGLGLGLFQNCGDEEEIIEIVQEVIDAPQLPMLAGLPLGHGSANLTVPVGLEAVMDTECGEVRFSEPATV